MSSPPARPAQRLILSIQYLRAIAALAVVWYHAAGQVAGVDRLLPAEFGLSGVDLFFVISGFIMVATTGPSMSPLEFMRRRIVRVVPLYWLLTLAMVAAAVVAPSLFHTLTVSGRTLAESLLFIPHFSASFPDMVWPLLVPGWTLNYEMFFYVAFALSMLAPARARMASLAAVLGALVAAGYLLGPFDDAIRRTYTHPLLLEFLAGSLIARAWLKHRRGPPTWIAVPLGLAGAAMLVLRGATPLGYFTQSVGATLVVVAALDAALSSWNSRVLRALGDASYSIYLTHLFALGAVRVAWSHAVPRTDTPALAATYMLLALAACCVAGYAAFRWIETPLLRRLHGKPLPAR